jgi:ABC-type hemin transport system ATPase subunit
LTILLLQEEVARGLGVAVGWIRMFLVGVAALLAAGAVSATGVVVLREGRLITQGVPRDMLAPDLIAEVFGSGPGVV